MKPRDYLRVATIEALQGPADFADSLEDAARRMPDAPPSVWTAVAVAREGDLRTALWSLRHFGLSDTLTLAGAAAPGSARELADKLRALPPIGPAAIRLAQSVLYTWLLLLLGGTVWASAKIWVAPILSELLEREVTLGYLSGVFFVVGMAPAFLLGGVLLLALLDSRLRVRLIARLSGSYDRARALLATGVLVGHGLPAAEALDHLDPPARRAGHAALLELRDEALEPEVLLEAGRQAADEASSTLERRLAGLRTGAVVVLGFLYGAIAFDVYRVVATLSGGITP